MITVYRSIGILLLICVAVTGLFESQTPATAQAPQLAATSAPEPRTRKIPVNTLITESINKDHAIRRYVAVLPSAGDVVVSVDRPSSGSFTFNIINPKGIRMGAGGETTVSMFTTPSSNGKDRHRQVDQVAEAQEAQSRVEVEVSIDPQSGLDETLTVGVFVVKPVQLVADKPLDGQLSANRPFAEFEFNPGSDAVMLQITDKRTGESLSSFVKIIQDTGFSVPCVTNYRPALYNLKFSYTPQGTCTVLVSKAGKPEASRFQIKYSVFHPTLLQNTQVVTVSPDHPMEVLAFDEIKGKTATLTFKSLQQRSVTLSIAVSKGSHGGMTFYGMGEPAPVEIKSDEDGTGYIFITLPTDITTPMSIQIQMTTKG